MDIMVDFDKAWISEGSDVDRYFQYVKEAYMAEIKKGKRIQI